MLVIRYLRVGKKNQPSFQIVVAEKGKAPRTGRFVEKVGFYNPLTKEKSVNVERVKYWLSVGAQPSATVWNLLVSEKITEGKKKPVHKKSKKQEEKKVTEESKATKEPKAVEATKGTEVAEETKETKTAEEAKDTEETKEPKAAKEPEETKATEEIKGEPTEVPSDAAAAAEPKTE